MALERYAYSRIYLAGELRRWEADVPDTLKDYWAEYHNV